MKTIRVTRSNLPISRPGIYAGISLDDYHSTLVTPGPSVSSSGLRRLWQTSPAHFYAAWEYNPNRIEETASEAMILGAAAHHLLLGEDDFQTHYVMRPETLKGEDGLKPWQGNRKACREWLTEQRRAGRTVLTPAQIDTIRGMAKSLARHPDVSDGQILYGEIERSGFIRDKETGLWLRIRPDAWPIDGDFCDLKTIVSISNLAIWSAMREHAYHQQGALVWEVIEGLGLPFDSFSLLFVEKDPPYAVRRATLSDDALVRGRRQNREMLRTIAECIDRNEWPAPLDIDALDVSKAEAERIDARLDQLETDRAAPRPANDNIAIGEMLIAG